MQVPHDACSRSGKSLILCLANMLLSWQLHNEVRDRLIVVWLLWHLYHPMGSPHSGKKIRIMVDLTSMKGRMHKTGKTMVRVAYFLSEHECCLACVSCYDWPCAKFLWI